LRVEGLNPGAGMFCLVYGVCMRTVALVESDGNNHMIAENEKRERFLWRRGRSMGYVL